MTELMHAPERPLATVDAGAPSDIIRLIDKATELGGVEQLERLISLYERMQAKNAERQFTEAMRQLQAECPLIPKRSERRITGSGAVRVDKYAALQDVQPILAPLKDKYGFSDSFDTVEEGGKLVVTCTVSHVGGHSKTHSFPMPTAVSDRVMNQQQGYGTALTYAERHCMRQAYSLVAGDDNDGALPGDADQFEIITEEQQRQLNDQIIEVAADKAGFLKFMGAASLSDIPASRFQFAWDALQAKRNRK